ncbi:MAG TPA: hypothetical protein VFX59_26400 [Polyangiales bacterium]|nr:hypothetical protein [Polyangiales bacterium]
MPVTLGVVRAVQAVALGSVLLVAGVVWGRVGSLEGKVDHVQEDVGQLRERTAGVEAQVVGLRREFAEERDSTRREFVYVRSEMRDGFAEMRAEMSDGFAQTRAEMSSLRAEMRAAFGDLKARLPKR